MKKDIHGQIILDEKDLCNHYLQNPDAMLNRAYVSKEILFDTQLNLEHIPKLKVYEADQLSTKSFDEHNQHHWFMPPQYYELDIAEWVLHQCENEEQLQRCGAELLRYAELDMLVLLQYLKYLVDTMRLNNIVWGVGRGSSVSSYVLYKIGVHKIDSLYYGLEFNEFLK
jgi:DNA polymerase III alpha subunit